MDIEEESKPTGSGETGFTFSPPTAEDGLKVHRLVANCPPLDGNSMYCNLLQCDHFAATSVKVERAGQLVAFTSGYIPPNQPDTLFIWQVAVSSSVRGNGLGTRMLNALIQRPCCQQVRYLHTTVTENNMPSTQLFERFARRLSAPLVKSPLYERNRHFGGTHDTEIRFAIGPLR